MRKKGLMKWTRSPTVRVDSGEVVETILTVRQTELSQLWFDNMASNVSLHERGECTREQDELQSRSTSKSRQDILLLGIGYKISPISGETLGYLILKNTSKRVWDMYS